MVADDRNPYVLGTEDLELQRLGNQHQTWVQQCYELFAAAELKVGSRLLDLGSGPGFTTLELARLVGPTGTVLAIDQSPRFITHLQALTQGMPQVQTLTADLVTADLPAESFDGAYARWLFCWLPDPRAALARVVRALRPGAPLLLHEYLDWGAMRLLPEDAAFRRGVDACLRHWPESGSDIDFARRVPALAAEFGLQLERLQPIARIGREGSLEWRWLREFFAIFLPKLVAAGKLDEPTARAAVAAMAPREDGPPRFCCAPTVGAVILRRPR